jgi:hypothetical protein
VVQIDGPRWLKGLHRLHPEEAGIYSAIVGLIYAEQGPISQNFNVIANALTGVKPCEVEKSVGCLCDHCLLFKTDDDKLMDWTCAELLGWFP